jgi:hypothetical protein
LLGDRGGGTRQKPLDRDDERPDLGRKADIGDLVPVRFRAELEVVGDALQRREHPADRDSDHERQKNDQAQKRRDGAQRALVGDLVANSRLLSDGDAEASVVAADHEPPRDAANGDRLEAVRSVGAQTGRGAFWLPGTLRLSGQDNEPRLRICVRRSGRLDRGSREALSLRPRGRLAELVVLQLDGFAERVPIGEEARRNRDQDDGQG